MISEVLMKCSCEDRFNLIGRRFGNGNIVLAYIGKGNRNESRWLAECGTCHKEWEISTRGITSKNNQTQSCRVCANKKMGENNIKDLTGLVFGNNCKILRLGKKDKNDIYLWIAECGVCHSEFNIRSFGIKETLCCQKCFGKPNGLKLRKIKIGMKKNGCEVVSFSHINNCKKLIYNVKCICGDIFHRSTSLILKDDDLMCKLCRRKSVAEKNIIDLVGHKFGPHGSIVIERLDSRKFHSVEYLCICGYCGEEFITSQKRICEKNDPIQGCLKCKIERQNYLSGEEHPNWNFDLTDEDRLMSGCRMNSETYKEFHKKALKRGNYKCFLCGHKNSLNVHHLDGFHWYKEGRFNEENSVVLCKNCHDEFHNICGRKNNTKQQFIDYVCHKILVKQLNG